MKHTITIKNGSLDITTGNLVNRLIGRLDKKLVSFEDDLAELTLLIKKHERHHFYSAVLTLRLPHKPLVANVGSHNLEDLLHQGFTKLEKAFEVYKGKHFKGSSKYGEHPSIRG